MSLSSTKKRRLDNAARTLSKPFKSPVRQNQNIALGGAPTGLKHAAEATFQDTKKGTADGPGNLGNAASNRTSVSCYGSNITNSDPNNTSPSGFQPSSQTNKSVRNIWPPTLVRQNAVLERQIQMLWTEVDSLTQASKITESSRDEELEILTLKWRDLSRAAAEELFAGVKDRVNRMGGVAAWREREVERRERLKERNSELVAEPIDGEDYDDEDQGRDYQSCRAKKARWKREKEAEVIEQYGLEHDEYDERDQLDKEQNLLVELENDVKEAFTIDMMLRSLHVNLEVIGFDAGLQQWID